MNREKMTQCMRDGCTYQQVHQINNYIDNLEQENQKLKSDYGNKAQVERDLLLEENERLKDNWNYIKKMLKEARQEEFNINGYCGTCTDVDIDFLLNKMRELERGRINE